MILWLSRCISYSVLLCIERVRFGSVQSWAGRIVSEGDGGKEVRMKGPGPGYALPFGPIGAKLGGVLKRP